MPWHHIIPKHEWKYRFGNLDGVDASDNLVNLTTKQHAEVHMLLYEQYGRWQDDLAHKMISGAIGLEEGIRITQSKANIGNKYRLGKSKSIEERIKISKSNKGQIPWHTGSGMGPHTGRKLSEEHKKSLSLAMRGKNTSPKSEEHKRKLSLSQIGKTKPGRPRKTETKHAIRY